MENLYKTADYESLCFYFFDVIEAAYTQGLCSKALAEAMGKYPKLTNDPGQAVVHFLRAAVPLVCNAYYPQVLSLLLNRLAAEQDHRALETEQMHMIDFSRTIIDLIPAFEVEPFMAIIGLSTLRVRTYAATVFYSKLPAGVKKFGDCLATTDIVFPSSSV